MRETLRHRPHPQLYPAKPLSVSTKPGCQTGDPPAETHPEVICVLTEHLWTQVRGRPLPLLACLPTLKNKTQRKHFKGMRTEVSARNHQGKPSQGQTQAHATTRVCLLNLPTIPAPGRQGGQNLDAKLPGPAAPFPPRCPWHGGGILIPDK